MEKQINAVNKKIENIMTAIEQGIITVTTKEKLMQLESEKTDLETKLNSILNRSQAFNYKRGARLFEQFCRA